MLEFILQISKETNDETKEKEREKNECPFKQNCYCQF